MDDLYEDIILFMDFGILLDLGILLDFGSLVDFDDFIDFDDFMDFDFLLLLETVFFADLPVEMEGAVVGDIVGKPDAVQVGPDEIVGWIDGAID